MDKVSQNGIGKAIYADFLPKALAEGSYVAAPEPEIVGKGLEHVQTAYHRQEEGMSASLVGGAQLPRKQCRDAGHDL